MKYLALKNLVGVNIKIVPELDVIDEAFEISLSHRVTIYDALYIALAEKRNMTLVSLDKKQVGVARERGGKAQLVQI